MRVHLHGGWPVEGPQWRGWGGVVPKVWLQVRPAGGAKGLTPQMPLSRGFGG